MYVAVSRHGVRGIGSLAVAYGGALAVRCALSVCCIAPNYVVYVVYPHSVDIIKKKLQEGLLSSTRGYLRAESEMVFQSYGTIR
jgi:hypothetical protein